MSKLRIIYGAEKTILQSFGFAWMIAGKYFKLFVDREDELFFFKKIDHLDNPLLSSE